MTDTVASRFLSRARSQPESAAVVLATTPTALTISYQGLHEAATRASTSMKGLERGSVVALHGGSVVDTIVHCLGAWLSDLVPAPLDNGLPRDVRDTLLDRFGLHAIDCSDSSLRTSDSTIATDPGTAYVIFTSGSTGSAKGVPISHSAVVALLDWHADRYATGPGDRVTLLSNPGFDASVKEIWTSLTSGATVVAPPAGFRPTPRSIRSLWRDHDITVSDVPVRILELLFEDDDWPTSVREIITGGDRLRAWPPDGCLARVTNEYGPTEATVSATASGDLRGYDVKDGSPPIGRVLPGLSALLDVQDGSGPLKMSPGLVGELWLSGVQVTAGYLPAIDAGPSTDAFVEVDGTTWYRTGDLVRVRDDGELDFVSRNGGYVKVNGIRIDLTTIEEATLRVPGVTQCCAVTVGQDRDAVGVLFSGTLTSRELRGELVGRLPPGWVPLLVEQADKVPLNRRNKTDEAAVRALLEAVRTTPRPAS